MTKSTCRRALVAVLFAATARGAQAQSRPTAPSEDEIRRKVTQRLPCRFEETVRFTVPDGQAVALQCAPNPFDLDEFVIYPDGDSTIWYLYDDRPTGKPYRRVQGSFEQIDVAPCAAIIRWTINGPELQIEFRLTEDKQKLAEAYKQVGKERSAWSVAKRTDDFLPPLPIPEHERIAGFVRLWSEVKYNFVSFNKIPDLDWEKVLDEYLPQVQKAATAPEYYRVLRRCMALLHDGHTEVWGPSDEPRAAPPVCLSPADGKTVVSAVIDPEKIRDPARRAEYLAAGLKVGDEVTHIDGRAVSEVLREQLYPFICASTPQGLDRKAYPRLLSGEAGAKVRLSVRSLAGQERDVVLTRGYRRVRPTPLVHPPDGEIGDGIYYLSLNSFDNDDVVPRFERRLPAIRSARGLILDVRENAGGDSSKGDAIISHLTDQTLPGTHWKTRMYRPAYRAWGRSEEWQEGDSVVKAAAEAYLGPVVVLTGPDTASAAEDFLAVLQANRRAKLVGERTCGSTGQPLIINNLPGGGGARICTKRDTFPDGTEYVGVGIVPDVEVRPTAADLASGRDCVFEAGLAAMKQMITP